MRRLRAFLATALFMGGATVFLGGCQTFTISGSVTWPEKTIAAGDLLRFDPNVSSTLTMTGNLIIEGILDMEPAGPGVVHTITFANANESEFQGGGMTPLATDDGLWVMKGGRLNIIGSEREPWAKTTAGVALNASTITLDRDPTGWQVNDEISIAPTAGSDYTGFDLRTISAINGRTITLNTPTDHAHPGAQLPSGAYTRPEVLNLTRNVVIQGMPPAVPFPTYPNADLMNNPGRTHIFINNDTPTVQTIDYASIRNTGPRQGNASIGHFGGSQYVLGRYGLHFHMSGENNAGTDVIGTVVRDSGSHAFVAHSSNGVTFTKTIAYNDAETPYWWDVKANEEGNLVNAVTDNTTYDSTVAALINTDPHIGAGSMRLAGYTMACGTGNQVINSVAVGIDGSNSVQASGILWPEGANECANTWTVTNDVAHNNDGDGFFTWQNDFTDPHNHNNTFLSYRNAGACIEHGAYTNAFDFDHITCVEDDGAFYPTKNNPSVQADIVLHATSSGNPQNFTNITVRGGTNNRIANVVRTTKHQATAVKPTSLRRFDVSGYSGKAIAVSEDVTQYAGQFDFVCWTVPPDANGDTELDKIDFGFGTVHPQSVYRLQQRNGKSYKYTASTGWTDLADYALEPNCSV